MANFSKVDAINQMLAHCAMERVGALDTGGYSDAGSAEYHLDQVSKSVQARGWPCNKTRNKKYVLSSDGQLAFDSAVLQIEPSGPNETDQLVLRAGKAYDQKRSTFTLFAGEYYFNVIELLSWDDIPVDVQKIIIAEATALFERRHKGDPLVQQLIASDLAKAEMSAVRQNRPPTNIFPRNDTPMVSQPAQ